MKLKLILKGPDRLMGAQLEKTLEQGSLVIGRSPTADWTLPDPERVVSKTHCRIDRDFSGFVVTDTSTNGVHVNEEPVGFGLPRLLGNGDVLRLGDAVVLVRVDDTAAATPPPTGTRPVPAPPIAKPLPDGPFGTAAPQASPAESPTAPPLPADPAAAAVERILDDWWAPDEPLGSPVEPKSVDISPKQSAGAIPITTSPEEPLPSPSGDVAKLVDSLAGIELTAFARAVDEAAAELPEGERRKFQGRLRDLLTGGEARGR
ncbi:type VI secretion system-associated FHA domain protein [Rhizobiaceae sp. 2RAB30]